MAKSGKSGGGRGGGVHTTPKAGGTGWVNQKDGKELSSHRTKANAEKTGRKQAIAAGTEHTIHKKDGTIGEKNSYGNDPREKKG